MTAQQWFTISEDKLACAINGEVFRDDAGLFSRVREELELYYPDRIWRMRLVNALHDFSQYGQANYGRCMARGDAAAAELCRARGIEAAMTLAFLIRRTYAPYYKWTWRALTELPGCMPLAQSLKRLSLLPSQQPVWEMYEYSPLHPNPDDRIEQAFEEAARILADMLYAAGLTEDKTSFLEYHCAYLSAHLNEPVVPRE